MGIAASYMVNTGATGGHYTLSLPWLQRIYGITPKGSGKGWILAGCPGK